MLRDLVQELETGIEIEDMEVYAAKKSAGRTSDEVRLEIYVRKGDAKDHLLYLKTFFGQPPYLRPWTELYGINPVLSLDDTCNYFDSELEEKLLQLISSRLQGGGKMYVEYQEDRETAYGLQYNFPVPVTRLGFILFKMDFTWFKDWYFPEGGSEGTQKLQGEKPLDEDARIRHTEKMVSEIEIFVEKMEDELENGEYGKNILLKNAFERANNILPDISSKSDPRR
jgi:hypothetical protein